MVNLLYRTETNWDAEEERLRIIDGRDRAQLYVDGQWGRNPISDRDWGKIFFIRVKRKRCLD